MTADVAYRLYIIGKDIGKDNESFSLYSFGKRFQIFRPR